MKFTIEGHMTARDQKYLQSAFEYCRKNGMIECKVNQKVFHFDFDSCEGYVQPIEGARKAEVITRLFWNPA